MTSDHTRFLAVCCAASITAGAGWAGGAMLASPSRSAPQNQGVAVQPGRPGAPAPPVGTALLAGQVVDQGGKPLSGAAVSLLDRTGRGASRRVAGDSQGRFFFSRLPAGGFTIVADTPGYILGTPLVVDLAEAERLVSVRVRLLKVASTSGVVRDEAGDPVVGTEVIVFRRAIAQGRPPALVPAGRGRTDDRGVYRVTGLPPGAYYICACSRDPIPFDGQLLTTLASDPFSLMGVAARALTMGADAATLDATLRTYPPTFHPNSPLVSRATRLTLAPGDDKTGVDVDVAAVRAARVSGTVTGAPGITANMLQLIPVGDVPEAVSLVRLPPVLVQADGRFDFTGVPPGPYTLEVNYQPGMRSARGPSGAALAFAGARGAAMGGSFAPTFAEQPLWATMPITVSGDDVRGLLIGLRQGATVTGKIEVPNGAPSPQANRTLIGMSPIDATLGGGRVPVGRINPDGAFRIDGVVPGRYVLQTAGPTVATFKSFSVGGIDYTDAAITVDAAGLADVVIAFTDTPLATIDGAAMVGQGRADTDFWVRLFPTDRRMWTEPVTAIRRFKSVRVTPKGTFSLTGVPAGEYFIALAVDEFGNEWQDAVLLDIASRTAQRIQVADGEKKTVDVKR